MATPRARVGENTKTQLLIVLCALWILLGLTGHAPWKPLESTSIVIVSNLIEGVSLADAAILADVETNSTPLYYLTAAASAKLLSPLLSLHDGARVINAVWVTILLLMVGMTGRELWSRGVGRHATFIMIGTVGLVMSTHSLNHEVATLTSAATGFYALALSKRRPWRASGLLGLAIAIGFLSDGLMVPIILLTTAIVLMAGFRAWRTSSFSKVLMTSLLIATPPIAAWLAVMYFQHPAMLDLWWNQSVTFNQSNHFYFSRILIWFAWPALPLAMLALWQFRRHLLAKPKFQLILIFFICTLLMLGFHATSKDINALPLLLPLVALGAGGVEHLKRGIAAALNWFGISLFGLIGFLVWLGWVAMMTGHPAKIKERMLFLSGTDNAQLNLFGLIFAIVITAIWLLTCLRAKQTNKSTVTNWAVGMTFAWGLLMTLWLPWIDAAKSYQPVFSSLQKTLSSQPNCISSLNVGESQRMLFYYYTKNKLATENAGNLHECDYYLIQDVRGTGRMQPSDEWQLIWRGKRAADRKESFRLYKKAVAAPLIPTSGI